MINPLGFVRVSKRKFLGYDKKTDEKLYSEFETLKHRYNGIVSEWKPNLLTNVGRDKIHQMVYLNETAIQRGFGCIGLTQTALTPAATDTVLSGEITGVTGLARAEASTKSHTTGTNTTTIEHTFTTTVAVNSPGVRGAALFDQLSGGVMGHINSFTTQTLVDFDQLRITWLITAG